jgi:hypothetical protein
MDFDAASGTYQWDSSGCLKGCSGFGFSLLVKTVGPFTNSELGFHLSSVGVGT